MASSSNSKSKKRKYKEDYIQYGFTVFQDKGSEKPQCVLCHKILGADSMRPNKLKTHLQSVHKEYAEKEKSFFERKLHSIKAARLDSTGHFFQQNFAATVASYEVAYLVAKCKKPHTIAETLIKPCVEIIVKNMLGEELANKVNSVQLSNSTIQRRIYDLHDDIESQLLSKIRESVLFSIQLDESTDIESLSQLMCFVRYVDENSIQTDLLFCKPLSTTANATDVIKIIDEYFKDNKLDWEKLAAITSDGAPAMLGIKSGVVTLAKEKSSSLIANHCCLHRQVLSSKYMPEDFSEVFAQIVKIINYIKNKPTLARQFSQMCKENENEHYSKLLFFTAIRWLSRGTAILRFYQLRKSLHQFLEGHQAAIYLSDTTWMAKVAFLADIFIAMNKLNKSLQGRNSNIIEAIEKLKGFAEKLTFWIRRVQNDKYEHFENLNNFLKENNMNCEFKDSIVEHMSNISKQMESYFKSDMKNLENDQWVAYPFSKDSDVSDDLYELKEEYIDLKNDGTLKAHYDEVSVDKFWCKRLKEDGYNRLAKAALRKLLIAPTSWECEAAFSQMTILKSKQRNRLNLEKDLRVAISNIKPRITYIAEKNLKQHHHSH